MQDHIDLHGMTDHDILLVTATTVNTIANRQYDLIQAIANVKEHQIEQDGIVAGVIKVCKERHGIDAPPGLSKAKKGGLLAVLVTGFLAIAYGIKEAIQFWKG
jgi:hypothetical protein